MQLEIREARPEDAEAIIGILNPIIAARVSFATIDGQYVDEIIVERLLA